MALSILKITGTGTSLRSILRSLNSYRGARMVSTMNRSAEAQVSSSSHSPFSSSSSPLLMLSPSSYNTCYGLYNFAKNRVFNIPKSEKYATKIVGSSHGWLACFNYRRNELFLSNPLSGRRVNLPPIDNLSIPKSSLRSGIKKIIISCSDPESEECRAMMLFNTMSELAYCCPGINSTEWTPIKSINEDFVYCATHELLFTTRLTGNSRFEPKSELEAWDLQNPLSPSLVWSCDFNKLESCYGGQSNQAQDYPSSFDQQEYLVVSQKGELFLVFRYIDRNVLPDGSHASVDPENYLILKSKYPPKTVDYTVYKIVREGYGGKKVYMDGHLDDQVMFIGWLSHGMAIPAADADGFQPNTICFTDDAYSLRRLPRGTDNGIFDYKNKTFHPCYYPCDYVSLRKKMPPPLWLTPN